MGMKVVLIGAGSMAFSTGLLADFVADGGEWEIGLCDINEESLGGIYGLAERLIKAKGAPITLRKSAERRDLLPGADVVVTTVAVGGSDARQADVSIQRKYGVYADKHSYSIKDTTPILQAHHSG